MNIISREWRECLFLPVLIFSAVISSCTQDNRFSPVSTPSPAKQNILPSPAVTTVVPTISKPAATAGEAALRQSDLLLSKFNPEREFGVIVELSSDKYEGRRTGTAGAQAASSYIAAAYSDLGLSPWSQLGLTSYMEPFALGGIADDNIIGVIPGSGAGFVIVGAHYDHLGINASGQIFNGADDNAAGVAALLETARVVRESGLTPAKTLVFAAFSGEEEGEFGAMALGSLITSKGLTDEVEMINIDGIGATGGNYFGVWDEGATNTASLVKSIKLAGDHLQIAVKEEGTDIGSDAQPFDWLYNIPAVTVDWSWGQDASAFHPYYHTPQDDPQYIDKQVLSDATKIAITALWLRSAGI